MRNQRFKVHPRLLKTRNKKYDGLNSLDTNLLYLCTNCGYILGEHYGGGGIRDIFKYNGLCPIHENEKPRPRATYLRDSDYVHPEFFPSINDKILLL